MPIISGGGSGGSATNLAAGKATRSAGNVTTTSTTWVDVTGMTITITTGAHRVLLTFIGVAQNNTVGGITELDFTVDGTRQGGSIGLMFVSTPVVNGNFNAGFTFVTDALSAGSHTFKVRWQVSNTSTGTLNADANSPLVFTATELLAA